MSSGQEYGLPLLLGSVPGARGEVEGLDQLWGGAHESHRLPSLTTLCAPGTVPSTQSITSTPFVPALGAII